MFTINQETEKLITEDLDELIFAIYRNDVSILLLESPTGRESIIRFLTSKINGGTAEEQFKANLTLAALYIKTTELVLYMHPDKEGLVLTFLKVGKPSEVAGFVKTLFSDISADKVKTVVDNAILAKGLVNAAGRYLISNEYPASFEKLQGDFINWGIMTGLIQGLYDNVNGATTGTARSGLVVNYLSNVGTVTFSIGANDISTSILGTSSSYSGTGVMLVKGNHVELFNMIKANL